MSRSAACASSPRSFCLKKGTYHSVKGMLRRKLKNNQQRERERDIYIYNMHLHVVYVQFVWC